MKKIWISLLLGVCSLAWAKAQTVDNYKFTVSTDGAYTDLVDATAVSSIPNNLTLDLSGYVYGAGEGAEGFKQLAENNSSEVLSITGFNIGFDFELGGQAYDKFAVVGSGHIILGKKTDEKVPFKNSDFLISRMDGVVNAAIGIGTTAKTYGLTVSYKVEGEAGAKVLTVQFANIAYENAEATDKMNYQIKLYEADNRIEMIFKGYAAGIELEGNTTRFNLGLNMADTYRHYRKPTNNWDNTVYDNNNTRGIWDALEPFPANLKYTFSVPEPCEVPTYTVTAINLFPKSTTMDMVIDVDTTGKKADGVLVLVSKNPITESPANGQVYAKDAEALGGTVLASGTFDDFSLKSQDRAHLAFTHGDNRNNKLTPNESFYYTVFMMNSKQCIARYSSKVEKQGATATTAPSKLTLVSASTSEVKLTAEANDLNEEIAILKTSQRGTDNNSNRVYVGNFDINIPSTVKVGDRFPTFYTEMRVNYYDTVEVLYIGPAKADITCPVNLKDNRVYYFGAVSKGKNNGAYSSLVANAAPYLTPAKLPFTDNFQQNLSAAENEPFIGGWKNVKNFGYNRNSSNGVWTIFTDPSDPKDSVQEAYLPIPALDFPKDSNVLVNITYSGQPSGNSRVEGDSICLEISTDAGQTFRLLKAVHKYTDNMTLGKYIIKDYAENGVSQAVLRLRVVCANKKAWNIKAVTIKVTALPLCPMPGAASVSVNYGSTLGLSWAAGENGETQWNFSMAADTNAGETLAWSRPVLVTEKPHYLTGLDDREIYHARVQAVCAGGLTSEWVASRVQAGRVPSFTEDFNKEKSPANWSEGYFYISSYGASASWYGSRAKYKIYKTSTEPASDQTDYNGALAYDMDGGGSYAQMPLLATPTFEVNAIEKPQFVFDAAYGKIVNEVLTAMPEADKKDAHKVILFVSDSGVSKFKVKTNKNADNKDTIDVSNAIQIWDAAELMTWHAGKHITVDLTPHINNGKRIMSLVFLVIVTNEAGEETYMLHLDNIGVTNTIPLARNLKVKEVKSKLEDGALTAEATIKWVADRNVAKWLVKVEGVEGETLTSPRYFEATGNEQRITGLNQEKTYKASVSHEYTTSGKTTPDTATWVSITFTTPGMACAEPTALATSNITRKSVVLTWEGNAADGYRVRYRPVAKAGAAPMEYINVEVKANTCTLAALDNETEYECGVQAICNKTAEFESEFVSFDNFTTLRLTCFAPTTPRVIEQKPQTAKVTWDGTSSAYQVAWSLQSEVAWTYGPVVTESNYTIDGLDYEQFYMFKVRGVCSPDSSEWSDVVRFRTEARPACPNPTNLRVEDLTQTSATLLWDTEAEAVSGDIQGYRLRHRLASVQAWDTIENIKAKTYAITDMAPKTAYVWAVQTVCADKRYSENWAQLRFETKAKDSTPDPTAVEDLTAKSGLYVTTSRGQIYIMNPRAVQIDHIRIFSTEGRQLEQYAVRSSDNMILTTAVRHSVAVVEVQSAKQFYRFKVLIP